MANVVREDWEKEEIASYANEHSNNAAQKKYGCHHSTVKKYQQMYGGKVKLPAVEIVEDEYSAQRLENEVHKLKQENARLKNKIADFVMEKEDG